MILFPLSLWSSMYNETLHDKTGSFLASVSANILQLSDWHIQQIRNLVPSWQHFGAFLANFDELLDLSSDDIDRLFDAIYPETIDMD